ncbi:forkhead box protein N4 isoform X1 [Anguilla anguilla]|uniref:forkhead box protein N4 isoform X1 n=2 Tax=Anguilla anguilla TaxID=7936 RepID=UPI0015AA445A|nr:forkhead box protein N4 isoform X1 [Anguilla anguilla]XP_035292301.1 forkhead box protein N4 isoform X1 [Anguilla anguilla]
MIESGITSRMSEILGNSGQSHHPSPQDYRLLTTDPSQLNEDDLPGDLQSLSWLTSVDVPRLQQMTTAGRLDFSVAAQGNLLEQQTAQLNNMNVSSGQATMIHLQSNMQNSILGMSGISGHSGNMTSYSLNGQPSPGFQSHPSVYQPSPQQVFTLAQTGQQCSAAGLYSSTSYSNQGPFNQPRLAPHSNQDLQPKSFPKPIYSYSCLIAMALKNSKTGSLPVSEIYSFMKEHFPYFKTAPDGWKNSVRHNLSLNKCFEKVENKLSGSSRKGCLWALNPAKIDKMEEEMQKWKRKDLPAIRRSMANPDELDKLITDRPESCRRKPCDPGVTRLPSGPTGGLTLPAQLQPQPVMTLSLQCLPLHQHQHHHQHQQHQHQLQAQTRLAPGSPAPAQTPPLHTVPDLSHSPLAQHPGKPPHEFYSLHGDVTAEVDTLDPSIMDFALQGNLWEEMKDESFNLETLGAFSNSPLRLSDCDLGGGAGAGAGGGLAGASGGSGLSFSDLQVTGLYAAYSGLDSVSAQYMGPQGGSKPIALL